MRSIRHERAKQWDNINEDISDALDNGVCLLALIQGIAQARVYGDNLLNVPENLLDKVSTSLGRDDVVVFKVADPHLWKRGAINGGVGEYQVGSKTERERTSRRYSMSRTKSLSV